MASRCENTGQATGSLPTGCRLRFWTSVHWFAEIYLNNTRSSRKEIIYDWYLLWYMRPRVSDKQIELYECFHCGKRDSDAETQVCPSCGGERLNLGRSRDL